MVVLFIELQDLIATETPVQMCHIAAIAIAEAASSSVDTFREMSWIHVVSHFFSLTSDKFYADSSVIS